MKHFFLFMGLCSLFTLFSTQKCDAIENNNQIGSTQMGQTLAREKPQLLLYYLPWCPYSQKVLDYLKQILEPYIKAQAELFNDDDDALNQSKHLKNQKMASSIVSNIGDKTMCNEIIRKMTPRLALSKAIID